MPSSLKAANVKYVIGEVEQAVKILTKRCKHMTDRPEQPTSRLDRIEALLLQTAVQQQTNTEAIDNLKQRFDNVGDSFDQTTQAISRLEANQEALQQQLEASISHLVGLIGDFVEEAQQDRAVIREIQSEVRGIQTENQRILQYLFGRQDENP
nr:hypothetical protein [Nostoc sp. EkiNYC01]